MNILFVGDIVGKVGRKALKINLGNIIEKYKIDFVIANGENISRGRGMNENHYQFLVNEGVDCVTLGNHYKDRDEIASYIDFYDNIVRPANLNESFPGVGTQEFDVNGVKIRVTNLLGETYMNVPVVKPYQILSEIVKNDNSDIHIVDFHAETTGEKKAYAYAFCGKISALLGTHTHVQTADASILEGETFYISDVGMCGSSTGILGVEKNSVIEKIVLDEPNARFVYLEDDDSIFNAVVLKFDAITFKPQEIIPLNILKKKGEKDG